MIRFKGEYSEECKIEKLKRNGKITRIGFAIALLVGLSVELCKIIVLGISKSDIVSVILLVISLSLAFFSTFVIPKRGITNTMTTKVIIDQDGVQSDNTKRKKKIKRIIKTANSYYVITPWGGEVVCPRHLMVKGTEEEFEAMFPGKIVYKD